MNRLKIKGGVIYKNKFFIKFANVDTVYLKT